MLDRWATLVATGGNKTPTAETTVVGQLVNTGYDVALEREKLAFERQKLALEVRRLEEERAERARLAGLEAKRQEEERALERERIQLAKDKLAAHIAERQALADEAQAEAQFRQERLDRETEERLKRYGVKHAFREGQLKLRQEKLEMERLRNEATVFKLKQYGDAFRNSV
jgi:hypothetical protein